MNGVFLQGGGAKGSFQAGAVYAMYEKGINMNVLAGTSIGAVNGYYIYRDSIEVMRKYYTEVDLVKTISGIKVSNTVPNDFIIDELQGLSKKNPYVKSFFVNYDKVENKELKENVVDIVKVKKEEALKAVKYSSLLPYVCPKGVNEVTFDRALECYNPEELSVKFSEKLQGGHYDGFSLDGGMLNNNFMEPFVTNKVDRLYLIVLHNNFEIPKYLLDSYDRSQIILIERKELFKANDTLNYSKEFLIQLFKEGYEVGKRIL